MEITGKTRIFIFFVAKLPKSIRGKPLDDFSFDYYNLK